MYWFVSGIITGYICQTIDLKKFVAMVMKLYYQNTEHTLEPYNKSKGSHIIRYTYKDEEYKILLPSFKRGPPSIVDITDVTTNQSVYLELKPFLGPDHKGHGTHLSPASLGFTALILHLMDGTEIDVETDQSIVLTTS